MPLRCSLCDRVAPEGASHCPHDATPLFPGLEERPLLPGAVIGEYVLEEKIGEGGMGEVWRGRQPSIGKRVAIKVLSEQMRANPRAVQRFQQEAQAANAIQNRHIVDIFAFGALPDGRPYLVMEYLSGMSLGAYMDERGLLPLTEVLALVGQVCKALGAAHERGIIHRDLKPENIFLVLEPNEPPFVKLLDFGIAKLVGDAPGSRLTRTGAIFGTPAYMSPEQCEGSKEVDHRADIYALGIIVFELIAGRTPFYQQGDGVGSIISRHLHAVPPPPSSLPGARPVPPALDTFICQRALAKSPDDRPQRCPEFFRELGEAAASPYAEVAYLPTEPPHARPESPRTLPSTPPELLPRRAPSRWWIALGAAVALLAGGGVVLYQYTPAPPAVPPPLPASSTPTPATLPQAQSGPASVPASAPVPVATVRIHIESTPSKARVLLDGEALGETPLSREIPYGDKERALVIEKEGYLSEARALVPNVSYRETLLLKRAKPSGNKPPTPPPDKPKPPSGPIDPNGVIEIKLPE